MAPFDDLIAAADRRLDLLPLETMTIEIAGRAYVIEAVRDQDQLLAAAGDLETFPFGLLLWEAAVVMADVIVGSLPLPASVLELGAGPGLAGIVAAARGAAVTQTDHSPEALALCRRNAQANGLTQIAIQHGDWRTWTDAARYDAVIGADILYERDLYGDILRVIETTLTPGGRLILTDPGRTHAGEFVAALRDARFDVTETRRMVNALPPCDPGARVAVDVIEAVRS